MNGYSTYCPVAKAAEILAERWTLLLVRDLLQHINTGKLRALAVMGRKRVGVLDDVPTIVSAGYPKLVVEDWAGILVKAGTPPAVIARLNGAINKALKTDKVREALSKLGVDTGGGTPEAFGALVRSETEHWTKVVQKAGIKINP